MDYLLYEPEDFASDESYLRYFFRSNEQDIHFWQDWISKNPQRLDVIMNADHLINFLCLQLPEDEFQKEYEKLISALQLRRGLSGTGPGFSRTLGSKNNMPAGAVVFSNTATKRSSRHIYAFLTASVLLLAALLFYSPSIFHKKRPYPLSAVTNNLIETINRGKLPLQLKLEDGTVITLNSGSALHYPLHFLADKREVYLDGEAFFEVSRNPGRPFFVYSNALVTHVLGTSFNVKADKIKNEIEVDVRTGRVEVYENLGQVRMDISKKNNNGVILTPNQKVVYSEESRHFESSLVDNPLPIPKGTKNNVVPEKSLVFSEEPLPVILSLLQDKYGVEIMVENENLNKCLFTGDIKEENLYSQMDIICKTLNASYEVKGTKILIKGEGCN